jgi:COP9 signalosome complex subunit 1
MSVQVDKQGETAAHPRIQLDNDWLQDTRRKARSGLEKLEVELKNYQNNLIKESTRVSSCCAPFFFGILVLTIVFACQLGYREIGNFQYLIGELHDALRAHAKSRDFCTTSAHVLEMCLSVIDIALELQNYNSIRSHVIKAEAALESQGASSKAKEKAPQARLPGMVALSSDSRDSERNSISQRLAIASGVAEIGQRNYLRAARSLLQVSSLAKLEDSGGHFIPANEIVLHATLCGLATFDRAELKRSIIDNAELRPLLELEPHLREVISCFHSNRYRQALATLERHRVRSFPICLCCPISCAKLGGKSLIFDRLVPLLARFTSFSPRATLDFHDSITRHRAIFHPVFVCQSVADGRGLWFPREQDGRRGDSSYPRWKSQGADRYARPG